MKGLDYTALTVAIIGAVNWGLIGFFRLDLVALIFGNMTWYWDRRKNRNPLVYAEKGGMRGFSFAVLGRTKQILRPSVWF